MCDAASHVLNVLRLICCVAFSIAFDCVVFWVLVWECTLGTRWKDFIIGCKTEGGGTKPPPPEGFETLNNGTTVGVVVSQRKTRKKEKTPLPRLLSAVFAKTGSGQTQEIRTQKCSSRLPVLLLLYLVVVVLLLLLKCCALLLHTLSQQQQQQQQGWVDEERVQEFAHPPADDTQVFVCGLPSVYDSLCGPRNEKGLAPMSVLSRLGYSAEMVFKF